MQWNIPAKEESIKQTVDHLKENGIDSLVVTTGKAAKEKLLELLPKGSEVMTMTSVTLDSIDATKVINESDDFTSVRMQLNNLNRQTQSEQMQKIGAAPQYAVGSVHAVTEDGKIVVASNTGSQLPAYAYGSTHVIWIVGTQKIVKNLDEAMQRIYEYVLPKETIRAREAYHQPDTFHSNVSKLLIINKEVVPHRLTVIFVKEELGF